MSSATLYIIRRLFIIVKGKNRGQQTGRSCFDPPWFIQQLRAPLHKIPRYDTADEAAQLCNGDQDGQIFDSKLEHVSLLPLGLGW